ncbi:MAG: tRNA pseudouridine(38-40) synthase TruA [Clostridia bacterium]|nr:tRNA pseudouridine(38-40) synthase TruA [Clostridia bacterium]
MRIRMVISYDGTNYVGWQTQPNGITVQEEIEKALFKLTGEKTVLHGSGRTDSGVHARAQVAHFDTNSRIPADKFSFALNTHLPKDIRIMYSGEADSEFHSRFTAKRKTYCYTVQSGVHEDPFMRNTSLFIHSPLDFDAMQKEAQAVVGTHDFAAFRSTGTVNKTTVRTVFESYWTKKENLFVYTVCGDGFLYNMVRILAGTMIDVGMGRIEAGAVRRALESADRSDAGATAPSHGLMLKRVIYPDFDTEEVLGK